ncbi:RluA family pseudouridine synthase [Candidatus Peregrinibacteria bacterium HGW-Peregrinibacteria-1]|jgi:23S rRNA pseudouridine1911/1915/1917 synthase|nr:MAG: RluA family pseudouridine synthase [Candidatus Peregrinibacteria bacterium HGW-Peregrinibacteria-1]
MDFIISDLDSGVRIDSFLTERLDGVSRNKIQGVIKKSEVFVNGVVVKSNYILRSGDMVVVPEILFAKEDEGDEGGRRMEESTVSGVRKIYEAEDYMVVDKPSGILVHPSERGGEDSLVNLFWDEIGDDLKAFNQLRPGIVHRLDKDTSGLLIIAKTMKGYKFFVDVFKKRKIDKFYLALVQGVPNYKEGWVDSPIGRSGADRKKMAVVNEEDGKNALTKYRILESYSWAQNSLTMLEVKIETGRTHQIRVHLAAIGHAVVGDRVYGSAGFVRKVKKELGLERQFLHAFRLAFTDCDGKKQLFESALPDDLSGIISKVNEA